MLALALALALSVLPSTDNRTDFTAAGGTDFAFTWKYAASTQVEVYKDSVLQVAGYVVNPDGAKGADGLYTGGTVVFTPAPAVGTTVRIQRTLPLTQTSVWTPYSAFKAKTLEGQLDALAMKDQQVKRDLDDYIATDTAVAATANGDTPITATGSTTPRKLKDRAADVVNVKDFGAKGDYVPSTDTGTDDTAAFLAAVDRAAATGGRIVIPAGRYLITDTITLTKSFAITGAKRPGGPGAAESAWGTAVYFRSTNAAKSAFRIAASPAYAADGSYFADFELRHVSQPVNQHGIVFDATSFSTLTMERVTFWSMTGYAVWFKGNVYAQNLRFTDLGFFMVGGLWGREAGTSVDGLDVTRAEVRNINLDWGINQTSPQSPSVDFSGWRELHVSNLLLEGGRANATAGGVGVLLGGNAYSVIDGMHEEFSVAGFTNGIVIADPTYGGPPMGLFDLRNVQPATPIRVSAALAQVFLRGVAYWGNPGSLAGIVTVDAGSKANVVVDGLQTAHLATGQAALKDMHRVAVSNVKAMYGTENNGGTWADSMTVFRWTARDGDPSLAKTKAAWIYPVAASISGTPQMATDADEGRVWTYDGVGNAMPQVEVRVTPHTTWAGAQVIVAVRYKCESAATVGYCQILTSSSEGGTTSLVGDTSDVGAPAWRTAYALVSDYTNDGLLTFYSRSLGSPDAPWTLKIAEIRVVVGREIPRLIGNVLSTEKINGTMAAAPSAGAYITGDRVNFSVATAGGDIGAICTAGGSPGTWRTIRDPAETAAQADSVAADVATLKTDFNALLAKLRTAGVMAP